MSRSFACYFDEVLTPGGLKSIVKRSKAELRNRGVEFDTLVGTGFSGAVVIPTLAAALDVDFLLVRKEGDDSHHGGGNLVGRMGDRLLFVDDFIGTGATFCRVRDKVEERWYSYSEDETPPKIVGAWLYSNGASQPFRKPEDLPQKLEVSL